jgi:K+-sensing histidine kinase KdpD
MFEMPDNDSDIGMNSQLTARDKGGEMNSERDNLINCPTILTGMSHEMRTHMNSIVAFSFLMKENCSENSEHEEFSNQILSSCEQLIGLFDSFLDSALIDSGNSKVDSKVCQLDNILDELFSEFRENLKKADQKELELITEIQFSNPVEVFVDKYRVFRVIRSLFSNSLKNTKSGYIKIGQNFKDGKVIFYVLDSGQGYFKCKEFLQTDDINKSLTQYNDAHTAINITLAKKLIRMLGGTIWIECNGLAGAGIYFSIPVKVAANSNANMNKYLNKMIAI